MSALASLEKDGSGTISRRRLALEAAGVCAAALGGAYLTSVAAGRLGFPVSRDLIFEGQWRASGWDRFPWLDAMGMLLFMFALPVAWRRLRRIPPAGTRSVRRILVVSALGVAGVALVYAARRLWGGPPAAEGLAILSVYWLIVALAEEAAFRGALQAGGESAFGIGVALPVAVLAFVLWHGWPESWAQFLIRAAAGVAFGLPYHASRSLIPPVLCHGLLNIALAA